MQPVILMANSVSEALAKGLTLLSGPAIVREASRNGGVSVWNGPVITQSTNPLKRVLFSAKRNANPFFHLFESLWMIGGRNDLPWVAQFNKQMAHYSDDGGKTQPAAYGFRWRGYFGYDQLPVIIKELRRDPTTRRCVLSMWDGAAYGAKDSDLMSAVMGSKDVPCNTHCYFTVRENRLYMSVACRSNDVLWGAHGANAVHFSVLLEYVAALAGYEVGEMTQYSWNYHLYDGILKHSVDDVVRDLETSDRYTRGIVPMGVSPIFDAATMAEFHTDLSTLLQHMDPAQDERPKPRLAHGFLKGTALPMWEAWCAWKVGDLVLAHARCMGIEAVDWRTACTEWLARKVK